MAENNTVVKVKEFFRGGWSDNRHWRPRARQNLRFYHGNQWQPDDREALEQAGRPVLTVNRVLPTVNFISGVQRQNRYDFKAFPRRGGTQIVADSITELVKHTMDQSNGEWESALWFMMALVAAKGWIGIDISYDNDPLNGDLVIEHVASAFDVVEDRRNEAYDLNKSAEFIIRRSKERKKDLIAEFPKKKAEIEAAAELPPHEMPDYIEELDEDPQDDYHRAMEELAKLSPGQMQERKGLSVLECWYKTKENRTFLVNRKTLQVSPVADKKKSKDLANAFVNANQDWQMVDRVTKVLRMAKVLGNTVLEEKTDPFNGVCLFPYVRYCPYWLDGNVMGMVDNLVSPQEEHNKGRSQELAILNSTANSGWLVNAVSAGYRRILETFGSKPGVVLEADKCGGRLEKIEPNKFPHGQDIMSQRSAADIKEISNVDANLQGQKPESSSGMESGRSRLLRQQQSMVASEVIFDNYRYSRITFGELLVEVIRKTDFYSQEEIIAIVSEANEKITKEQIGDVRLGRYGLRVEQSHSSPTVRLANFDLLLAAFKDGLPINPKFIIELSDLPNREEILKDLKMQQAVMAQMAAAQAQSA